MKALRNLLRKVLSLNDEQVRAANQTIKTGSDPYITVRLLTSIPTGNAYITFDGEREKEQANTSYTSTVSLNAYGTGSYQLMLRVVAVLQLSQAATEFKKINAGLLSFSPIRDLSGMVGAGNEERAQVDMQITHIHKVETDLKRFDTVTVTPKI